TRQRVGDIDAVEVVAVVPGGTDGTADVRIVQAGLRGRVAAGGGLDARHELQVALVATAGRQRLHHVQGQRGADGGGGGVDGGERRTRDDHGVEAGHAERITEAEVLAADNGDVAGGEVVVAGSVDDHGVVGRRIEALQADATVGLGHAGAADQAVGGTDRHGRAGKRGAVGAGDGDAQAAGFGRQGRTDEAHAQRDRQRAALQALYEEVRIHFETPIERYPSCVYSCPAVRPDRPT